MATRLDITRRDFMNGMALSLAAGTTLSPLDILAMQTDGAGSYYPPALTGMRGSHPGSFETAHAVAWAGTRFPMPKTQTDDLYDLVVVGGGISGLSAAKFFRDRAERDVKILILDNHDDFGGHAKRNEFNVDGKTLVAFGGSQNIDSPNNYSPVAKQLLKDLAIDVQRFYDYFDQDFYKNRNLGDAIFFDQKSYGVDRVLPNPLGGFVDDAAPGAITESNIRQIPISREAQDVLLALLAGGIDYLAGKSKQEKLELLNSISYVDFLQEYVGAPAEVTTILRDTILPIWGIGWDALSALRATHFGNPGTGELGIGL